MSRSQKYTLCRDKWNFFFWISRNMALKLEYWCNFVGFTVRRGALSWRTLYSLFPIQFLDSKAIYLPRSRMASWNCVINCGECETFCCNFYYYYWWWEDSCLCRVYLWLIFYDGGTTLIPECLTTMHPVEHVQSNQEEACHQRGRAGVQVDSLLTSHELTVQ